MLDLRRPKLSSLKFNVELTTKFNLNPSGCFGNENMRLDITSALYFVKITYNLNIL